MNILCGPDLECWNDNYSRPDDEYGSTRHRDWWETACAMLELAAREKVEIAIFPGDHYMTSKPPATAEISVHKFFSAFKEMGIPVVACEGNHPYVGPGRPGPVDVLAELADQNWGITVPKTVIVKGLQISVLPYTKPAALIDQSEGAGDLANMVSARLVSIIRGLAIELDPGLPAILIGHWAIAGCMTSSGHILHGGEPALPLGDLQGLPYRAVIMGHIHKPQVFPGRPIALHTGAFQRRDFGEERDERGCYILDTETGEAAWHDLPCRKFCTVHRVIESPEGVHRLYEACRNADRIADTIVRVTYKTTEELAMQVDHHIILDHLRHCGPAFIAGIEPELIRSDRIRVAGLAEQKSPMDAAVQWLENQRPDLSLDMRREVQEALAELMGEVTTNADS